MKSFAPTISTFVVSVLFFASTALAQEFLPTGGLGDAINEFWTTGLGLPSDWLVLPTFIYNFVIPFIAIFAVALGLLRELRIYQRSPNIEAVLAFVIAFSTLPTRAFVTLVAWTLAAMGWFAYIIFVVLFFVGSAIFGYGRLRYGSQEMLIAQKGYVEAYRKLQDLQQNISTHKSGLATAIYHERQKLPGAKAKDLKQIEARISDMESQIVKLNEQEMLVIEKFRTLKRTEAQ